MSNPQRIQGLTKMAVRNSLVIKKMKLKIILLEEIWGLIIVVIDNSTLIRVISIVNFDIIIF